MVNRNRSRAEKRPLTRTCGHKGSPLAHSGSLVHCAGRNLSENKLTWEQQGGTWAGLNLVRSLQQKQG